MRLVACGDASYRLDISGKADGRGLYLCHDAACLERVLQPQGRRRLPFHLDEASRKLLTELWQATRSEAATDPEKERQKSLEHYLHLARKAGALSRGYDACREALENGQAKLLLYAGDGAGKRIAALRAKAEEEAVAACAFADKKRLGNLLGRSAVAFLTINEAGLAAEAAACMDNRDSCGAWRDEGTED